MRGPRSLNPLQLLRSAGRHIPGTQTPKTLSRSALPQCCCCEESYQAVRADRIPCRNMIHEAQNGGLEANSVTLLMGRVRVAPMRDVIFVYVWSPYISWGLVISANSSPPPRIRFHHHRPRSVSLGIPTRDFTNTSVDVSPVFTCRLSPHPPFSMYDIQTLFTAPEGFRSKTVVTSLRAFGDKTNAMPLRPSAGKPVRAGFTPPRFASRKASATVALTSTTALRTWKPIPTMPQDYSQREENFIPFPTASIGEQPPAHHTPVVLKRPLPVEARRRRSGALVPASARASTAVVVRPVAKRPRKSKRVLADLQFMASVQRSIVALHVETRNSRKVTTDTGVDAMDVEDGLVGGAMVVARTREELCGLDQQLVARLAQRLRTGGFASPLMDASLAMENDGQLRLHVPQEGTRAPPPSPEMDSGVYAMDVNPDPLPVSLMPSFAPRTPPLSSMPPPPPPTPLGNSPPPSSPPGLVSPRVRTEVPAEKRIYTMEQLVAAHIMRLHERGSARTPNFHPRAPRSCSPLCESVVP